MEHRNPLNTHPETTSTPIETVMVIDDDANWVFISKLYLKKAGIKNEVITAKNGQEAISKLQELTSNGDQKLPDLIFVDLWMPVMDGFELLEQITQLNQLDLSQTKVYVCSSSFNPQDKEKASQFPITGFLTKPFNQETLKEILG
ncbi:response regulator [Rufibacter latericius]|uniref:Response regulator n=1 Tax=Rufibacter latericius TaxID=2487040 RepID=A0A3M9MUX1_9BACT|nr:response regulator [Rufibacter latericius]RNI29310.1 response regulator [Rufibacter latericius]